MVSISQKQLPILNYHGIESFPGEYAWHEEEKGYVLELSRFSEQLDELKSGGFKTLDLSGIRDWLSGREFEAPCAVLTFDDGHVCHFDYTLNSLKLRKFTGIFFVTAGFVGKKGYLSWSQLRDLVDEGFAVGSHGLNHIPLTGLRAREVWEEFKVSKELIENTLGVSVLSFSIPRGYDHPKFRKVAEEAGYQFVFNSRFDTNSRNQNELSLRRMAVTKDTDMESFRRLVAGELGLRRHSEKMKSLLRQTLPPQVYDWMAKMKQKAAGVS